MDKSKEEKKIMGRSYGMQEATNEPRTYNIMGSNPILYVYDVATLLL